jgi:hypothetical protein
MLWAIFILTFLVGMFFGVILILFVAWLISTHDERVAKRNVNYAAEQLGGTVIDEYPSEDR